MTADGVARSNAAATFVAMRMLLPMPDNGLQRGPITHAQPFSQGFVRSRLLGSYVGCHWPAACDSPVSIASCVTFSIRSRSELVDASLRDAAVPFPIQI
jgi:hypothetical protein